MSKKFVIAINTIGLTLIFTSPIFAQENVSNQPVDVTTLLPAAFILFLPLGLLLLISSAMPDDQAPTVAINLLIGWAVAALAYFAVGFAFQFGGIAQVSPNPDFRGLYWEWYPLDQSVAVEVARSWGVIALQGWFLAGDDATPTVLNLFLSHLALVGVAAMVPAGLLFERKRPFAALVLCLFTGGLIYPVAGNWVWGGGWLASLGAGLNFGHGLVDFGGASVIFLTAAAAALVVLYLFRPAQDSAADIGDELIISTTSDRLTVYEQATTPVDNPADILQPAPMPSAYLPLLSMIGSGLLLLGWVGLSSGVHAPTALNFTPAHAAVSGLLAALAAATTAAAYSAFTTREFNPLMTSRGLVAGLILSMAAAPFAPIGVLVVAGLVMGLLLPLLIYVFDQRLPLADHLGTLTTYGVSAVFSLLLVAFLADGRAGLGWNGSGLTEFRGVTGQGVSGLVVAPGFASDWPSQLQAQLLGGGVILAWALLISIVVLQTVRTVANAWRRSGLEWTRPSTHPTEFNADEGRAAPNASTTGLPEEDAGPAETMAIRR